MTLSAHQIEALRPGFESWYPVAHAKAIEPLHRHAYGYYSKVNVQAAWQGYLAALSSMLTEEAVMAGAKAALGVNDPLTAENDEDGEWTLYVDEARATLTAAMGLGEGE